MEKAINIILDTNIQYLKGVGPSKAELFKNLGINTIRDLIYHFPRSYEDRTVVKNIREFVVGESVLFIATISGDLKTSRIRKNLTIHSTYAVDKTGMCKITWFNQNYLKKTVKEGDTYLFYGKISYDIGRFVVENPLIYNISEIENVRGIYPIYTLTAGITQNYLFKLISNIDIKSYEYDEIFSENILKRFGICSKEYAVNKIHFPKSFEEVKIARKRLIFEELFLLQLALLSIKNNSLSQHKTIIMKDTDISSFLKLLPYELTNAQKRVVEEIKKDLSSDKKMNRLVQGDVGSGKTIVAALAIYIAVKNGYQASLMAPTTILATQHFLELKKYFEALDITSEIITSSTTKKQKEKIIERLSSGDIDVIIGTHSIIEDNILFKNLGLVVTDEQHRFGVKQRMKISSKGENVETLVMTATPIPRSLALMLYGDLDLSIIDELPPGRKKVDTFAVDDSYETRINKFIKKEIDNGRQIYVVCPLVEENEKMNLESVLNVYKRYKNEIFTEYEVAYIHGKMKNKEKEEIMKKFKEGSINILISTTVIEVGVNVPNASIMIIENADRFGLAALHQLRGRVGRGENKSYCILKSNNRSQNALERLKILEKSNSGFEVAEKDLTIRGPGDFFGIRQHGLPEFKLANLLTDVNLLKEAQVYAKQIIEEDRNLESKENKKIKEEMFKTFGDQLKNIGT